MVEGLVVTKPALPLLRDDDDNVKVFIGIKTSAVGVYNERLPQIQKTWLKDALKMKGIDIKFFTHIDKNDNATDHSESSAGGPLLDSLMVTTPCGRIRNIACKMSHVFSYFLEHHPSTVENSALWFCSFDDDNYVLVPNLLKVLSSYQQGPTKGQDIYLGKQSVKAGIFLYSMNTAIHFLTGGAGYCLSRNLVEQAREHFTNLAAVTHADDVAVGYIVQEKLGVNLTENDLFHSHLERQLRVRLPTNEIAKQVSFGFNNKAERLFPAVDHFPNVPILFPPEKDPLLFRSLRCFLTLQQSGVNAPECQNATASGAFE